MELEARSEIIPYSPLILLHDPMHSADNGWPHNALRHHWLMPIGCHFRDCKALLVTSLTHVSGAIPSVHTFTFTFRPTYVRDRQTDKSSDRRRAMLNVYPTGQTYNKWWWRWNDFIFDENVSIPQYFWNV